MSPFFFISFFFFFITLVKFVAAVPEDVAAWTETNLHELLLNVGGRRGDGLKQRRPTSQRFLLPSPSSYLPP